MALTVIAGRAGSEKSNRIYQKIIREAGEDPKRNFLVLVPEQFSMQTQKALTELHPGGCILNIDVLSFNRLAYRVFNETGDGKLPVLDDCGKMLVLQKLIRQNEAKLKLLTRSLRNPGSLDELKSLLCEFLTYGISPEDLSEMIASEQTGIRFRYKLEDIRLLYEAFCDYLERNFLTLEQIPDICARAIQKTEYFKDMVLVLDGFTGFVPSQMAVLNAALQQCAQVYVVVTADPDTVRFPKAFGNDLFSMSGKMISRLYAAAKEAGCAVTPPVLIESEEKEEETALRFLEKNIFTYSGRKYPGSDASVQIIEAGDPEEEITFIASRIRYLIRKKGYRYRDFAIVCGDMEGYGESVQKCFDRNQIPVFVDRRKPIKANQAADFIRSVLEMTAGNFAANDVFRFLRSGFAGLEKEKIDSFENYITAAGIRGWKRYQSPWTYLPTDFTKEELAEVNATRGEFVSLVSDFTMAMKKRNGSFLDKTKALHDLLIKCEIQEKCETRARWYEKAGDTEKAAEYDGIYRHLIDFLDKVVEMLGDQASGLEEYSRIIKSGLDGLKLGFVPQNSDCVMIGDIERTRLTDIKVLFLAGVNEGVIPKTRTAGGLLSETEREHFSEKNIELAPGAKEDICMQQFYLYLVLAKASDRLYLSYAMADRLAQTKERSNLIDTVLELLPNIRVEKAVDENRDLYLFETQEGMVRSLLQTIRGQGTPADLEFVSGMQKDPAGKEKLEKMLAAAGIVCPNTNISQETALDLYGSDVLFSATRLEQFSACEFAHFLRYGLRLKEQERYEFSNLDMGLLFHGAFENYARAVAQTGNRWDTISEIIADELARKAFDETLPQIKGLCDEDTFRNRFLQNSLRDLTLFSIGVLQEQVKAGSFTPFAFETPYRLGQIKGRIDRIDIYQNEELIYARVLDYKSSVKKFELGNFVQGFDLQLPLYLSAVTQMRKEFGGKKIDPAGFYYYGTYEPFVEVDSLETVVDPLKLLKEVRLRGMTRSEPEILALHDKVLAFGGYTSSVIEVKTNQDGGVSKNSHALDEEGFSTVAEYTKFQTDQMIKRIKSGAAGIDPRSGNHLDSCAYCEFKSICGFDLKIPGYKKGIIEKFSDDDAMDEIRNKLGKGGFELE